MVSKTPGVTQSASTCTGAPPGTDTVYYDILKPDRPVVWFPLDAPFMPTLHVRSGPSTAGSVLRAVRVALGSGSGKILAMVAREAGLLVGAGSIAGVAIAVATARLLSRVLPPTASLAPSLFVGRLCGNDAGDYRLGGVCAGIRACRVDPLAALRHEYGMDEGGSPGGESLGLTLSPANRTYPHFVGTVRRAGIGVKYYL
jgi:hypothetical protein